MAGDRRTGGGGEEAGRGGTDLSGQRYRICDSPPVEHCRRRKSWCRLRLCSSSFIIDSTIVLLLVLLFILKIVVLLPTAFILPRSHLARRAEERRPHRENLRNPLANREFRNFSVITNDYTQ